MPATAQVMNDTLMEVRTAESAPSFAGSYMTWISIATALSQHIHPHATPSSIQRTRCTYIPQVTCWRMHSCSSCRHSSSQPSNDVRHTAHRVPQVEHTPPVHKRVLDILPGVSGGVARIMVGQPFDTIKTRLQVRQAPHTAGCSCSQSASTRRQRLPSIVCSRLVLVLPLAGHLVAA